MSRFLVIDIASRLGWFVWSHPGDRFLVLISPDGDRAYPFPTWREASLYLLFEIGVLSARRFDEQART